MSEEEKDKQEAIEHSTKRLRDLVDTLGKVIEDIDRKKKAERPYDFHHKKPFKDNPEELLTQH